MNDNKLKKAVIYARYSSSSQTEQSIEGQLHDAYDFSEKNGYYIVREYIDRAISGTSDNRPSFQRMMKDAEKHDFQFILVWKFDRFARNRYDSAVHKHQLAKFGVKVVSVKEVITDTPEGVILEGLLEAMAEYYSADLSQKIKRGRRESVNKGLFPGGPVPLGYMVKDKRLVPDPKNAPVVREIFQRYAAGERMKRILDDLNARGYRGRYGQPFQHCTIMHILENKTYVGDYYYGDIYLPSAVEPLIDKETFQKAMAVREKHRRAPAANRTTDQPCMLLGKFFCGECGHRFIGGGGYNGKVKYRYYHCDGRQRKNTGCGMKRIQRYEIHYAVCRVVSDFILNKKRRTLTALADNIMKAYAEEIDLSEQGEVEAQLRQLERDLNKLVDSLITMPESARPRIAARMEELEAQKKDLEDRLSYLRVKNNTYFNRDDFAKWLQVTFTDLESPANQKFIIEKFINSVYLYNDGRLVVYLNQIPGLPFIDSDDNKPGKDDYKEITPISPPPAIAKLQEFSNCSSLYTYAPTYVDKDEQQPPLIFTLHGRIGIIVWRHVMDITPVFDYGNHVIAMVRKNPRG